MWLSHDASCVLQVRTKIGEGGFGDVWKAVALEPADSPSDASKRRPENVALGGNWRAE